MAQSKRPSADPSSDAAAEVVSHLEQAEEALRSQQAEWDERLARLERQVESTRETNRDLGRHLEDVQERLDEEHRRAERHRQRAAELVEAIRKLHHSLFGGNLYQLILQACLTISGATRGLYVTWRDTEQAPRVRAAIDIDGYPGAPPSDFVVGLCRRVLESRDTLVCNHLPEAEGLPEPASDAERFRNFAAVPTMLLKDFDGVVLVADKATGDFDEEDLETLLSIGDQAAVAMENIRLHRELQQAYLATISTLADAVEAKDPYTHGHCEMTSRYARLTAERLQLEDRERAIICYAALLHDVGKIGVSDGVLHKPGPLLPEERELVRAHVRVGHDLIRNVPGLEEVAHAVLHHHEWYDGAGYPDGLRAEEIPIASRVVAVVDAYGAMTTRRSYKEAYSEGHAREELQRCAGTQFDPRVTEAFLEVLDSPERDRMDDEGAIGCGVLPNFPHLREFHAASRA